MTSQEQATALKELDALYERASSFRSWLADKDARATYEQARQRLEQANPGLQVAYVDLTYRNAHALVPME